MLYPTDSIRLESHGKPAYVQDIVVRKVDGVWKFDLEKLLNYGQKYIRGESVYADGVEDTLTPEKKPPPSVNSFNQVCDDPHCVECGTPR